jgi:catechol 2,3-dioxygenase-like lactoylglutathione lyase family enzyme
LRFDRGVEYTGGEAHASPLASCVHHTCVISDMSRSLEFYKDILGMEEKLNEKYDADPVMMDLPDNEPNQNLVMVFAGNTIIELIQYIEPKGKPYDRRPCDITNMHRAFQIQNL